MPAEMTGKTGEAGITLNLDQQAQLAADLRRAINDCSERGLYNAAKWQVGTTASILRDTAAEPMLLSIVTAQGQRDARIDPYSRSKGQRLFLSTPTFRYAPTHWRRLSHVHSDQYRPGIRKSA